MQIAGNTIADFPQDTYEKAVGLTQGQVNPAFVNGLQAAGPSFVNGLQIVGNEIGTFAQDTYEKAVGITQGRFNPAFVNGLQSVGNGLQSVGNAIGTFAQDTYEKAVGITQGRYNPAFVNGLQTVQTSVFWKAAANTTLSNGLQLMESGVFGMSGQALVKVLQAGGVNIRSNNLLGLATDEDFANGYDELATKVSAIQKGLINGTASGIWSLATLGLGKDVELLSVSDAERANGYGTIFGIAKIGTEILGQLAIMGLTGGTSAGLALAAHGYFAAQSAVMMGQGLGSMLTEGVTATNLLQVVVGGFGLAVEGRAVANGVGGMLSRESAVAGEEIATATNQATRETATAAEETGAIAREGEVTGANQASRQTAAAAEETATLSRQAEIVDCLEGKACFAAGMPMLTPTGHKLIEKFEAGDLILCRSEFDPEGPLEAKVVEEVFVRSGRILNLHVGEQVIRTTLLHPFWVYNKGWMDAGHLQIGDILVSHDGQRVTVSDLHDTGEYERVYNLRVADYHTYFVGREEWGFSVWAHNTCTWEQMARDIDAGGAHSFADHGAHVTPAEHLTRLQTGVTPSGRMGQIPSTSGSFASNEMQVAAWAEADTLLWTNPNPIKANGSAFKQQVELTFNLPGAGTSYSLDSSGGLVATSADRVRALFRLNGTGDAYNLVTMYPIR